MGCVLRPALPVWFLHMLTYFMAMNPGLISKNLGPVAAPDYYAPREGDSPELAAWRARWGARKAEGLNPSSLPNIEVKLRGDEADLGEL